MLIVIVSIIAVVVAGGLIWLATLNGNYEVERSIVINKSNQDVFPLVADFQNWTKWSPWLCMEPKAKTTISEESNSIGAIYSWEGELVGSGEVEHLTLKQEESIAQEIRFKKPMSATSTVSWNFSSVNDSTTKVTWGMKGKMPFFFKFMTKYMAPMIGMDYDRGLKMLKDLAEKGRISSNIEIIGVVDAPQIYYIGKRTSCPMAEMEKSMTETFETLTPILENNKFETEVGLSIYHNFDLFATDCEYTSGFSTKGHHPAPEGGFISEKIPQIKAIKVVFKGDYKHLGNGWSAAYSYARSHKLSQSKKVALYELYLNNPQEEPNTDNWITEIYFPIK